MPLDELSTVTYRAVPNFPDYKVGDDGTVWSRAKNSRRGVLVDGWHMLIGGFDKDGYRKLILCKDGKRRYVRVNMLVLEVFVGPAPVGMKNATAAHQNGVRTDNRLANLLWKSQKDNIADKEIHGTAQVGERHGQALLTDEKVVEIRRMRRSGAKWKDIAAHFGVKLITVQAAGSGRNWKHIPM